MADTLSWKSGTVQNVHPTIVIELQGVDMDSMKEEYPDSAKFGTPYRLALVGEPGHYNIHEGWLLSTRVASTLVRHLEQQHYVMLMILLLGVIAASTALWRISSAIFIGHA